jgi:hypothetical protein
MIGLLLNRPNELEVMWNEAVIFNKSIAIGFLFSKDRWTYRKFYRHLNGII